jgi:hypothetical protein
LPAVSRLGGHNAGHRTDTKGLPERANCAEVNEAEGDDWRALEDDFRTLAFHDGRPF